MNENLVGGFNPSEKYWSIGMSIPNIWENKKCSKPPTSSVPKFERKSHIFIVSSSGLVALPLLPAMTPEIGIRRIRNTQRCSALASTDPSQSEGTDQDHYETEHYETVAL